MAFVFPSGTEIFITVNFFDQFGNVATTAPTWAVSDTRLLKIVAEKGNTATIMAVKPVKQVFIFAFGDGVAGLMEAQIIAPSTPVTTLTIGAPRAKLVPSTSLWARVKKFMLSPP